MKSKFIIEVETKDMKKVSCEEDELYKGKKMGDDITKEVEEDLHIEIKEIIRKDLEDLDSSKIVSLIDEDIIEGDVSIEGFEQLNDYGKVTITVKEVKNKMDSEYISYPIKDLIALIKNQNLEKQFIKELKKKS